MKSAVLVIDVQSVLFDPDPKPFEGDVVVHKINTVTRWARSKSDLVIFIQHEQAGSVIEFESEGWQLQSGLQVEAGDEFVRKTTPDSFLNTNLDALLKSNQIDHLIVCGYSTEFCVDTTVRRAASLGYSVVLAADAHTAHDKAHASGETIRLHHNSTLSVMSFGAMIAAIPVNDLVS